MDESHQQTVLRLLPATTILVRDTLHKTTSMTIHPEPKWDKKRTSINRGISIDQPGRRTKHSNGTAIHLPEDPERSTGGLAKGEAKKSRRRVRVWTVGHSTRPVDDFVSLLKAQEIRRLVDVRSIPRSRHNPQFNQDQFSESLKRAGIEYIHMPALGGLRHAHRNSINTGWRNKSFRGFADYMQTPEFVSGLNELIRLARSRRTAIMCAEAVPWRCHRSLIADALVAHGISVDEIMSKGATRPHTLTPWASVTGERITYPSAF